MWRQLLQEKEKLLGSTDEYNYIQDPKYSGLPPQMQASSSCTSHMARPGVRAAAHYWLAFSRQRIAVQPPAAVVMVPLDMCIIKHTCWLVCILFHFLRGCSHRRLIFTLREYPSTEDFVYLRRFQHHPAACNPYALEVVQFANADQSNYYTIRAGLSREGH